MLLRCFLVLCFITPAIARDGDDHGNHGILKPWFDSLKSGNGLCCSVADGVTIEDVDWDTGGDNGEFRVRIEGRWWPVPDNAVIKVPNRFGPAVVWPLYYDSHVYAIRCFIPGAGT